MFGAKRAKVKVIDAILRSRENDATRPVLIEERMIPPRDQNEKQEEVAVPTTLISYAPDGEYILECQSRRARVRVKDGVLLASNMA
jgi:hypothetical protein